MFASIPTMLVFILRQNHGYMEIHIQTIPLVPQTH
uniref:Uncharacterized protein n=1 Tax=Arundo donax TaxID=35708 RepID=A0A0A9APZ2_ARUDO